MSNDLMKKLEEKINEAIDTIELSRMEIIELKGQKEELENRYEDWEQRLSVLIEKFEILDEGTNSENKENVEDEENNFEEAPGSTDDIVNEEETTQEDSGIEEKIDLKDFDGDLNVDIQDAIENIDDTSIEDEIESLTYPNNDCCFAFVAT